MARLRQVDKNSRPAKLGRDSAKCDEIRTKVLPHAIPRRSHFAMYGNGQPNANSGVAKKWTKSELRLE